MILTAKVDLGQRKGLAIPTPSIPGVDPGVHETGSTPTRLIHEVVRQKPLDLNFRRSAPSRPACLVLQVALLLLILEVIRKLSRC